MTVEQASSERVWALGAAVTTAILATLYMDPAVWAYMAVATAAGLVVAGLLRVVVPAVRCPASRPNSKATTQQVLDLIKSRRSVQPKDFAGNKTSITQQQLETMLDAARWAPTHKNTEPWHFVVLSGNGKAEFEDLTIKCCEELLSAETSRQAVALLQSLQKKEWSKAHCYIAICLKRHEQTLPEWEEIAAVSCAVQNMSLVAHSLGISGYWCSWSCKNRQVARDSAAMHEFLGLDSSKGDRCLGVYVVGQGDAERVRGYRAKRQDLAQKVMWKN